MKNRIRRFSHKTFSAILALCLFVSCLTATNAAQVQSEAVGLNVQGSVYVDLSGATNWGTHVSYIVGKSGQSTSYNMTQLTGTKIYYKNIGSDWGSDATENGFHNGNWGNKNDAGQSISDRWGNTKHTSKNTSWGMDSGSTYLAVITGSSNDYGLSLSYHETGYGEFNKTLTIKTMLYNGSSYAESSTNCGTFSASNAVKITGDSATTAQSISQDNGTGTITTARTNVATISQSVVSGYKFMGWKDSKDTTGSSLSSGNYTFTNAGSNKTIYAYYKHVYTVTFSQPSNGSIMYNSSTTSPITVEHGTNVSLVVTPNTDYRIKSLTDNSSAVSAAAGKTVAYTYTISAISADHTIAAVMELNRTPLSAPSIKMANSTSNQTVNAKRGEKILLTWGSVTNAVAYEIYKDNVPVTTVNTTSYPIEKGNKYSGTYKVVAKPTDGDATYMASPASNEITLTVNKVQLAAPTVTQSATEVEAGSTVTFTITDTNSTNYTLNTDYKYQRSGENNTTYTDSPTGTWTTDALTTGGTRKFTFQTLSLQDDYYTSNTVEKTVYVSKAKFYLTGDLVTGSGGESGWPTNRNNNPINTYVSKDVFYAIVNVNTGGNSDNHYFRLTDLSYQYKKDNGTGNINMAEHSTAADGVTLTVKGDVHTQGAMYVTGKGTFMIYVDQSGTNPKVWVVNDKWLLTAKAYYQTYNLVTDTYNTAAEGTTGGTVSPTGDYFVTKQDSATYTATAESGYTFDGWYTSTDFGSGDKVSGAGATWTFTPEESADYYALFKQNAPARRTIYVDTKDHITVKATYNGTDHAEGTSFTVPHGAKVTVSYTLATGCELVGTPSPSLDSNNQFTATADTSVIVNAKLIDYTLTPVVTPAYGNIEFYSDSNYSTLITTGTANYNQTIYVKYITPPNANYEVHEFTLGGTSETVHLADGIYDRGWLKIIPNDPDDPNSVITVTAHVQLQYSVKYYVDMHSNNMTGKTLHIDIVDGSGNTLHDAHGNVCSSDLSHEGTGNVYSASIPTPLEKTGSDYNSLRVKVTYNGSSDVRELATNQIAALVVSREMWLEGVNESSQPTKLTYATNPGTTPFVADNMRRIYLAKPHSWGNGSDKWENIGIYYWGETATGASITWTQSIRMTYLGYDENSDDGYYYYYVDIPKPKSGGTSNIIFQGWGSKTSISSSSDIKAQTGNIENLPLSQNFMELVYENSKYTVKKLTAATLPSYTRYVQSVKMNVSATETPNTANIAPTYTGGGIRYTSSDPTKVSVSDSGVITALASTVDYSGSTPVDRPVTITVSVLGTVGALIPEANVTTLTDARDAVTYTLTVSVHNPATFNGFNIMAVASQLYTVTIPKPDNFPDNQPGYFDFDNCVVTVTGIQGAESTTSSAIITKVPGEAVIVGGEEKTTSFTVKYAKADSTLNFMRDADNKYENIVLTAVIVTKSIHESQAARFGFDHWEVDNEPETFRTTQVIGTGAEMGIETATTEDLVFDPAHSAYDAIFNQYEYVDVTFTYEYDEYVPKVVDNFTEYPYDAVWALEPEAHKTTTYIVYSYEVRDQTAETITASSLKIDAAKAIVNKPVNNYYDYSIDVSGITVDTRTPGSYTAEVTVNMSKALKYYSVYLNGSQLGNNYTYQQKVTAPATGSFSNDTGWYAVNDDEATPGANDPLLAVGSTYSFRVKGDTYLRTVGSTTLTDSEFNRSENDFSHYEISHRDDNKEYLLQNFYIADFFDPSKVKRGDTPEDDVTFVGGGVVYYSIKDGEPNSNAVDMGYVSSEGVMDTSSVKTMLQSAIEKEFYDHDGVDDAPGAVNRLNELGRDDAMKVAYGTEITAQQYIDPDNNIKTGMVIRYLPLETFKRENGDIVREALKDENGQPILDDNDQQAYGGYTLETTTNNNIFRYSNSLHSYQYIYASGNENKVTNNGRNMRLYSYYIYSYTDYDLETNVPSTKYVIVMSDNYSDASTYWSNAAATTNN